MKNFIFMIMMLITVSLSAQAKYFLITGAKETTPNFRTASGVIVVDKITDVEVISIYNDKYECLYNLAVVKTIKLSDRTEIITIDKDSKYGTIIIKEYKNHIIWKFTSKDNSTFTIKTTNYYL